jgi:hypothetical protein
MRTWPINFSLLGGNGLHLTKNDIKIKRQKYIERHGLRPTPNVYRLIYPPCFSDFLAVLRIRIRIRIHRIHVFLGLPDPNPDPLVRGMDPDPEPALDPDPSIIMQK